MNHASPLRPISLVFLALVLSVGLTVRADVLHVDDDASSDPGPGDPLLSDPLEDGTDLHPYDAIQEAIDSAMEGDEIVVSDGLYQGPGNYNLTFHGKGITLRSANGPEACIIDAQEAGRGVLFINGETTDTRLIGFTITNGFTDSQFGGGGIFCFLSSPQIENCRLHENVVNNNTSGRGGGMSVWFGNPVLNQCRFTENHAYGNQTRGGALFNTGQTLVITESVFLDNSIVQCNGHAQGGAIAQQFGSIELVNCEFSGNSVTVALCGAGGSALGGAVAIESGSINARNCIFRDNVTLYDSGGGGGIWIGPEAIADLFRCTIAGNEIGMSFFYGPGGGGILSESPHTNIRNCLLVANRLKPIYFVTDSQAFHGIGTLTNCTIVDNGDPKNLGTQIAVSGAPRILNSIVWGNGPTPIGEGATVDFSCVEGGWRGNGNLDFDPGFIDPAGQDDDPTSWTDNDYRLAPDSPCIDAGDSEIVFDVFDLDGRPRLIDQPCVPDTGRGQPPVDMGAYEMPDLDCNLNGETDFCDLYVGTSHDVNHSGVPDECECVGDGNGDGRINGRDLSALIREMRTCTENCRFDLDGDGVVGRRDMIILLDRFGHCP